jgi:hypothetical protein
MVNIFCYFFFIFYNLFIFVTFTLYDFCSYLLIVIYSHVMSLYKTFIFYLLECYNIVKMFHHIFLKMKRIFSCAFLKKKLVHFMQSHTAYSIWGTIIVMIVG